MVIEFLKRVQGFRHTRDLSTLTAEARSHERYRRIAATAAASGIATGVGIVVSLISVPLTVRYLGPEQYGLWVTITSAAALIGFADLGLSNGLVNGISEASGHNDNRSARLYLASTFYILILIALVVGVAFWLVYPAVSWGNVFNVASAHVGSVAGPSMALFLTLTLIGMPLGVAASVRAGYQEGYASAAWRAVGSAVTLVALIVAILLHVSLPWLVLTLGAGPLIAALMNGASILRARPWLAPRPRDVTIRATRTMIRLGVLFFVVQVASAAAFTTDNLVIARIMGADQVAQYAVPMKLFLIVPLVSNLLVTPLWPAYREALTRNDFAWVRVTMRRSIMAAGAWGVLASSLLVFFGSEIVRAWAGGDIAPTLSLLLAQGFWCLLLCLGNTLSVYMNAANVLGFQAICLSAMVVVNLALSIVLTRMWGLSGPAWGSVISVAVLLILPYSIYVKTSMRRLSQR